MPKVVIGADTSAAERGLKKTEEGLIRVARATQLTDKQIATLTKTDQRYVRSLQRIEASLDPLAAKELKRTRVVDTLTDRLEKNIITEDHYNKLLAQTNQKYDAATKSGGRFADSLRSIGALIGITFSAGALKSFLGGLVEVQKQLETIQARLSFAAGGNAGEGLKSFAFVAGEAKRLGIDLESSGRAFSKFSAAAQLTGVAASQVRKTFSAVAEAAATMRLSASDSERVFLALEQMVSKGVVSMEELRRQMGDALPAAFPIAAKAMGMTTAELDKLIRSGQLTTAEFLPKFTEELHKAFGPMAEKNVESLTGAVNNLNTAFFELKAAFLFSGAGDDLIRVFKATGEAISDVAVGLEIMLGYSDDLIELFGKIPLLGAGYKAYGQNRGGGAGGGTPETTSPDEALAGQIAGLLGHGPDTVIDPAKMDAWVDSVLKGIDATKKQEEEIKKLVKAYADLEGELDPVIRQYRKYQDQIEIVLRMRKLEKISAEQAIENLKGLAKAYSNELTPALVGYLDVQNNVLAAALKYQNAAKVGESQGRILINGKTQEELKAEARELEQIAENFYRNLQGAVSDSIYEFVKTGEFEFDKLWESFKDLAFRTIAEIAAKWATTKFADKFGDAGGGAGAFGVAAAIVGGILGLKGSADKKAENRRFDSAVGFNSTSEQALSFGGRQGYAAEGEILAAAQSFWSALREGAGIITNSVQTLGIRIRHDQKEFAVEMNGVALGTFSTLQEAILRGLKEQFNSATFGQEIPNALRELVDNFSGSNIDELREGIDLVNELADAASNLSQMGKEIRGTAAEFAAAGARLRELGVSGSEAVELMGGAFLQKINEWNRYFGGNEAETEEEAMARLQAEHALAQAELDLFRAQLGARAAFLQAQLDGTTTQVKIWDAELGAANKYLGTRARQTRAMAEMWQAELDAINKFLAALPTELGEIKLPKIHVNFSKSVGSFGKAVDKWADAARRLYEQVQSLKYNDSTTALTLRERVSGSYSQYQSLLAAAQGGNVTALGQVGGAFEEFLRLYKDFTGGGSGFLGNFGDLFDKNIALLESLATGPRPGKITEKNVVYDERLNQTAASLLVESELHREQDRGQMDDLIEATMNVWRETKNTTEEIGRLSTRQAEYEFGRAS